MWRMAVNNAPNGKSAPAPVTKVEKPVETKPAAPVVAKADPLPVVAKAPAPAPAKPKAAVEVRTVEPKPVVAKVAKPEPVKPVAAKPVKVAKPVVAVAKVVSTPKPKAKGPTTMPDTSIPMSTLAEKAKTMFTEFNDQIGRAHV
jgi:hypothetical protein